MDTPPNLPFVNAPAAPPRDPAPPTVPPPPPPVAPAAATTPPAAAPFVVPPPAPKSFFGLVADAAGAWKRQWLRLLIVTGLSVGVFAGAAAGFLGLGYIAKLGVAGTVAAFVLAIALVPVAFWVFLRTSIAWLALVARAEDGMSLGAAWSVGKGRVLSYLWTFFLSFLVVSGGYFLLVVPGVIWGVAFWILPFIFIIDGLGGRAALVQARRLVKDDTWRVLLHMTAFGLFIGIASLPIGLGARFLEGNRAALLVWQGLWGVVQLVILTPLGACFIHAVYADLRRRKGDALPPMPKQKTLFTVVAIIGVASFALMIGSSAFVVSKYLRTAAMFGGLKLGGEDAASLTSGKPDLEVTLGTVGEEPAPAPEPEPPPPPADDSDDDGDALTYATEIQLGTDSANSDTDGDGLADGDEVRVFLTSPIKASSAGSPYADGVNFKNGYNPLAPGQKLTEEDIVLLSGRVRTYGLNEPTRTTLGDLYR